MRRKSLKEIVLEAAVAGNGKRTLACARAFKLAERHGVTLREIGRVCNRENIRICGCQLGCFR